MIEYQKSCLKWLGGKAQLLDKIIPKIPKTMNNYHEIFLGSGTVLLAVLSLLEKNKLKIEGKIYAYDINKPLIYFFKNIQQHPHSFYKLLQYYKKEYQSITNSEVNRKPCTEEQAYTSKESYYYWLRKKFNLEEKISVRASVLLLVLNKLCFRGVYREGPNGFNVPYGHPKKIPTFVTEEDFYKIVNLIQKVEFIRMPYHDSIKRVKDGDFVYLDPPYAPENSKSFVGYNKEGFPIEDHLKLFKMIKNIPPAKFLLSNAKVDLVTDNFEEFDTEELEARRAINSKKPQSKTMEVLISN